MKWRSIYQTFAVLVLAASVLTPAVGWAEDKGRLITEIRGKKLFLYDSPTGKKIVERRSLDKLGKPLKISVKGEPKNGRYPIELDGELFWIGKAQVKESNFANTDIKAKCQGTTKSYASSRGLGNCE